VEVVTRGGTVGTRTLSISHNPEFIKGQKGMFLCKPVIYETDPNSSVASQFQFQLEDGLYFDYDYSKHYISTSYGDINFECIESLYEFIDPNYVADCLGAYPNGILQAQRYNDFLQVVNQKAANVIADNGTVIYTFENAHTTHHGGKAFFEFDVFISASASNPVYLDVASIKILYNFHAFGDSVVANNKITIQRGDVLASVTDYNSPSLYNDAFNVFAIGITSVNSAQNKTLIDYNPQELVKVRIEIEHCGKLPNLQFSDVSAMKSITYYTTTPYTPSNGLVNSFSYINANDTEQSDMCVMNVDDFNPKVVAGGVGDVVTITGHFFEGTKGVVALKNANTGGQTLVGLDDYDILTWNDSVIQIRIPAVTPINATTVSQLQIPGSGKLKIQQGLGLDEYETLDELRIEYSWKNYHIQNLKKGKVYMVGVDSVYDEDGIGQDLGYSFILNPNINSNLGAKDCINKAIKDWICATEIRWQIDQSIGVNPDVQDGISMMQMGQTSSSNVLAETAVWWDICTDGNGISLNLGFANDIDITYKDNINWFYDTTGTLAQPAGQYDFYAVALHELGHAHLLNHVNQQDDLMWYASLFNANDSIDWWRRKIFFEPINVSTGIEIINQSKQIDYSYCNKNDYPIFPLSKSFCSIPMSDQRFEVGAPKLEIQVVPNPFVTNPIIQITLPHDAEVSIRVYDVMGRLVVYQEDLRMGAGNNDIMLNNIKERGIFMGVLTVNGQTHSFKMIKQ
jgi:hypothetical protein